MLSSADHVAEPAIASSFEKGHRIPIYHLKRYWQKSLFKRTGQLPQQALIEENHRDKTLLKALGLGLEQTVVYLFQQAPAFEDFEDWILEVNNGYLPQERINRFNSEMEGKAAINEDPIEQVLDSTMLQYWEENGYLVLPNAVSREDCDAAIEAIGRFTGIQRHNPETWYRPHPSRQGIMIQFFQDPILEKIRNSITIRKAYEQLWNRKDLWVSTDRVSFNPPETAHWHFPGPHLHWDVSLQLPIPFGLQGLLYLSDTAANQGAFTLVPGFHKRIEHYLTTLPAGTDPRTDRSYYADAQPIAANAGDFILWHHALPHGSSPNKAQLPRIVQYINYSPLDKEEQVMFR